MTTWIGFLRAINLGATRKFPKGDILASTERAGGRSVATYINTGNVRFVHELTERGSVEEALERAFLADRGFDVPTICLTPAELRQVADDAAALDHPGRHYVSLLKQEPTPAQRSALEGASTEHERARVVGRAVHLLVRADYRHARLTNAVVERHVGVATNRNLNVIRTLADKWG